MAIKTRNPIPKGFNTSQVIKDGMKKSGVGQALLARRTDRNPNTIKMMRRRRSVQASILHEFSIAMGVDLFRPLSDNLPEHIRQSPEKEEIAQLQQEIEDLKKQLADQREVNAYMKKALDVVTKSAG